MDLHFSSYGLFIMGFCLCSPGTNVILTLICNTAIKLPHGFISDTSVAYVKPHAAARFIRQCFFFHGGVDVL